MLLPIANRQLYCLILPNSDGCTSHFQHHIHQAQHDRAQKRRQKSTHLKSRHQHRRKFQHQRVDHQPKQSQRDQRQRKRQIFSTNPTVALMNPIASAAIMRRGPLT